MTTASIPVFESIPVFVFKLKLREMFFFFQRWRLLARRTMQSREIQISLRL